MIYANDGSETSPKWIYRSFTLIFLSYILIVVILSVMKSHFIADDYDHFVSLQRVNFLSYLTEPIDVHFAPFHKLFSFIIFKTDPLNYILAVAVLSLFYASTGFILLLSFRRFCSPLASCLIIIFCLPNIFIFEIFFWWSSGIHRLPYLFFNALAIYSYLRCRNEKRIFWSILVVLTIVVSTGFFVKGILITVNIIALEISFLAIDGWSKNNRSAWRVCAVCIFITVSYIVWYKFFFIINLNVGKSCSNMGLIKDVLTHMFITYLHGLAGIKYKWQWGWKSYVIITIIILFAGYLIKENKKNIFVIGAYLFVLIVNFYVLASSSRVAMLGIFTAYVYRYYTEFGVITSVFIALLIYGAGKGRALKNKRTRLLNIFKYPITFWVISLVWLGFILMGSISHYKELGNHNYLKTKRYMHNYLTGIKSIPKDRPVFFLDGNVPLYVYGAFLNKPMLYSVFIPLKMPNARFDVFSETLYKIDKGGRVWELNAINGEIENFKQENVSPDKNSFAGCLSKTPRSFYYTENKISQDTFQSNILVINYRTDTDAGIKISMIKKRGEDALWETTLKLSPGRQSKLILMDELFQGKAIFQGYITIELLQGDNVCIDEVYVRKFENKK